MPTRSSITHDRATTPRVPPNTPTGSIHEDSDIESQHEEGTMCKTTFAPLVKKCLTALLVLGMTVPMVCAFVLIATKHNH
jgi:hypothetical protein